jgi:hypothetical protein
MTRWQQRKNRRIYNPQPINPKDPLLCINNRYVIPLSSPRRSMAADGRSTWLSSVRESAERQMASRSKKVTGRMCCVNISLPACKWVYRVMPSEVSSSEAWPERAPATTTTPRSHDNSEPYILQTTYSRIMRS